MYVVGMCCMLNEVEFIKNFFEHNLKLVDKMIVAEGSVIGYPFCDENGHSIDDTNEVLDEWKSKYPDKIEIVRKNGKWGSKQDQQNSMLKFVSDGDWCFIFGADEYYMPDTREKLERIVNGNLGLSEITFPCVHFFGDTKHMIVNKDFNSPNIIRREQRFFKYQSGMRYVNHPTLNDMYNRDFFFHEDYKKRKLNLGMKEEFDKFRYRSDLMGYWDYDDKNTIYRYHYGFIRDILMRTRKHIYYLMRDRGYLFADALKFLMDKTNNDQKTIFGYIEQIHSREETNLGGFSDKHPLMNKEFTHSKVDFKKILKEIGNFMENPRQ